MSQGNGNGGSEDEAGLKDSPHAEWSDAELLARIKRLRCEQAFAVLDDRHRPAVRARARQVLADDHLAEDIAQEVLVYLWKKIPDLTLPCNIQGFLSKVAFHKALNRLRQRQRLQFEDPQQSDFFDKAAAAGGADDAPAEFWKQIEIILSPPQARAVLLYYRDGLNIAELADQEGIKAKAARSRLKEARKKLRNSKKISPFRPSSSANINRNQ